MILSATIKLIDYITIIINVDLIYQRIINNTTATVVVSREQLL